MTVGFVYEREWANVGMQEDTLGLGRVAEYSHLRKESLATVIMEKNMNSLDILCQANQGIQSRPPPSK